jgi:hypothetical protein
MPGVNANMPRNPNDLDNDGGTNRRGIYRNGILYSGSATNGFRRPDQTNGMAGTNGFFRDPSNRNRPETNGISQGSGTNGVPLSGAVGTNGTVISPAR